MQVALCLLVSSVSPEHSQSFANPKVSSLIPGLVSYWNHDQTCFMHPPPSDSDIYIRKEFAGAINPLNYCMICIIRFLFF